MAYLLIHCVSGRKSYDINEKVRVTHIVYLLSLNGFPTTYPSAMGY